MSIGGWLYRWTGKRADQMRWADMRFHRNDRKLLTPDHSPLALIMPIAVMFFVVFGPVPERILSVGPLVLWLVAACAQVALCRFARWGRLALYSWGLVAALGALVWILAGSGSRQFDGGFWRHSYAVLAALVLLISATLGPHVSKWLFRPEKSLFEKCLRKHLERTQLFQPDITRSNLKVFNAFLLVLLDLPLPLLWAPSSLAVIASPEQKWVWFVGSLILMWILLAGVKINSRFLPFETALVRLFFRGGARVVSVTIIILAVTRLAGVSYVQTILDANRDLVIQSHIAALYVLFWAYDYWMGFSRGAHVLGALAGEVGPRVRMDYQPPTLANGRRAKPARIQVHGGGRLIAIRDVTEDERTSTQYSAYTFEEFAVAVLIAGGEERSRSRLSDVRNRRALSRLAPSTILTVLLGLGLWGLFGMSQVAVVEDAVAIPEGAHPDRMVERLAALSSPHDQPWLVVAASGGGTRAALHTRAVLRAVASAGKIDRVLLASGVSGGSVALSYWAAHHEALAGSMPSRELDNPWLAFETTMRAPYILDVLSGAMEWRLLCGHSNGELLAESLGRGFGSDRLLDTFDGFGLLLNCAIVGSERDGAATRRKAGGRLVFTNIAGLDLQAKPDDAGLGLRMEYVTVRSPTVKLYEAGALSANFPPVFSDVTVTVGDERYFLTDGGAVDNRGLLTLLLTLRKLLTELDGKTERIPNIHVLVADASAFSESYGQTRGVSVVFNASGMVASGLIGEVLGDVRKLCADYKAELVLFDVSMPLVLRESGSIGTHWMLQSNTKLTDPSGKESPITIDDPATLAELVDAVLLPDAERPASVPDRIWGWSGMNEARDEMKDALGVR